MEQHSSAAIAMLPASLGPMQEAVMFVAFECQAVLDVGVAADRRAEDSEPLLGWRERSNTPTPTCFHAGIWKRWAAAAGTEQLRICVPSLALCRAS